MAHATDIVGYVFKADTYCREHIMPAVMATKKYDGWELAKGVTMPVEQDLDEIAYAFQIDRQDESSFDADEFPKVIFRDQAEDTYCGVCGEPLE